MPFARPTSLLKGEGDAADNIRGGPEFSTLLERRLRFERVRFHALEPTLRQELEGRP